MKNRAILGPYPPPYEGVGIVAKQEYDRTGGLFIGTSRMAQKSESLDIVKKTRFIFNLWSLLGKIRKHRQEISGISAHFATTYGFVAYLAKKLYKISYTVTCHGSDILLNLDKFPHKILTRKALENADEIIVVSEALKQKILETGITNQTIKVVVNQPREEFRRTKTGKKKQIICVGTLYERKGQDRLVDAFGKIAKDYPDHKLVLVGRMTDKVFKRKLDWLIRYYHIQNRVEFLGERDDVYNLLNESELFVLPSRSEGYGLALAEALACGLPCIASNVGGVPEVPGKKANCTLINAGDIENLVHSMRKRLRK